MNRWIVKGVEKRRHGRSRAALRHQREVVMLLAERDETQAICLGNRSYGDAPIRPAVGNGRRDCIMRARLIPFSANPLSTPSLA